MERPNVECAAVAIEALVANSYLLSQPLAVELTTTPEPYRWAAIKLGYGHLDGTDWWDAVMEAIG